MANARAGIVEGQQGGAIPDAGTIGKIARWMLGVLSLDLSRRRPQNPFLGAEPLCGELRRNTELLQVRRAFIVFCKQLTALFQSTTDSRKALPEGIGKAAFRPIAERQARASTWTLDLKSMYAASRVMTLSLRLRPLL